MFFDDKIVEFVKNKNPKTAEEEVQVISELITMSMIKMTDEVNENGNPTIEKERICVKRMCIIWKSAYKKLKEANLNIFKEDAFYLYIESLDDGKFKHLLPNKNY